MLVETETRKLVVVRSVKDNLSSIPDDISGMNKRRGRLRIEDLLDASDFTHKTRDQARISEEGEEEEL